MKKYFLKILLIFAVFLNIPTKAMAAVIFFDSLSGGYNQSSWTVWPGQIPPIASSSGFGISIDPQHPNEFSSLIHPQTITGSVTIKMNMKVNSQPASDVGIYLYDIQASLWKNVYLFGVGYGGTPNTILLRDSSNTTGTSIPWNNSTGVHQLEISMSAAGNSPIILKIDGNSILSWTSIADFIPKEVVLSLYGTNSEFADFKLCDRDGCEAPPPPPPVTKVVLIPGFGGSWNADAILNCKKDHYEGDWTSWPMGDKVYKPIIDALNSSGFTAKPFYYDWRLQVPDTQLSLKKYINNNLALVANEKVDIVGHSMGGLIGRAYVESEGGQNKADKLMTVGTPHLGTLLAYPAWSAGEIWGNLLWKMAATIVTRSCQEKNITRKEIIQTNLPSVQNFLPIFDYLKDFRTKKFIEINGMTNQNNWLDPNKQPLFVNTLVGTLSGYGYETLRSIVVTQPSKRDLNLGNWVDGMPLKREFTNDGDGTILEMSSQLSGATNKLVNQTHTGLISSQEGISEILRFLSPGILKFAPLQLNQYNEPKSALVIIGYPAHFSITLDKETIQDDHGMIVVTDPKSGVFNFRLNPTSSPTKIVVAQFLPGDQVFWRQYQWKNSIQNRGVIRFNKEHPKEDILE